jgi:hypothetical protein
MVVMMAGEKPKEKHAMKYGFVLPLSGIERAIEQLVEYAHIAKEEGREAFTSRFFIKPPPEPDELWSWLSSFWEPKASWATVLARSGPRPIHPLGSTCRQS